MKVLLLGANGQVGTELRKRLAQEQGLELVAASRTGHLSDGATGEVADFEAPESLARLVRATAPDIVINAAAYTAVDRAETEPDLAFMVNAEAPRVLAEACRARDALLVHYSTDYVFNGRGKRPYREDDATDPLGVYGKSKLAGEEAIRLAGARHLILRTAWVYASHGHNFLRTMLRVGAERDVLRVVSDQVGTPTSANLIADATATLIGGPVPEPGTFHLTASGETSWHGFAEAIFAEATNLGLLAKAPSVEAISTEDYPTETSRPAYSVLDNTEVSAATGLVLPEWRAGVADVLGQLARVG